MTSEHTQMQFVWNKRIETLLDKIRINCINKSNYHSFKHQQYKGKLIYFRIPLIILSGINSVTAVGLQTYIKQTTISAINCGISLICGIITSIELFLNLQKKMEMEMASSRDYNKIAIEIFKVLSIDRENRMIDGKSFLDEKFADYLKLSQTSNITDEKNSVLDEMTRNVPFPEAMAQFERRITNSVLEYEPPRARPSSMFADFIPAVFSNKRTPSPLSSPQPPTQPYQNHNDSLSSISSAILGVVNTCKRITGVSGGGTTPPRPPPPPLIQPSALENGEISPHHHRRRTRQQHSYYEESSSEEQKTPTVAATAAAHEGENLRRVESRELYIGYETDEDNISTRATAATVATISTTEISPNKVYV